MKIERLHIDNFGKFSDYTIDFSDGFNLVFGNNEDGKTTIMSFIRLMFYGSGTSKSDLFSNLRRRYTPFSQEKMGGSIDFTHNGNSYTLSKQFGKTQKSDKVVLLDNALGTPINLPAGSEIGEMFFSLSAGAFEKSIYLGSLPPYAEDGTADLEKRLTAAVYTGDKGDGYEQIAKRITAAQTELRTPRKVGKTDKLRDEIIALDGELSAVKALEAERKEREEQVSRWTSELNTLKEEQKSLNELLKKSRTAEQSAAIKTELCTRRESAILEEELKVFPKANLDTARTLLKTYTELTAKTSALSKADAPTAADTTAQKAEFESANESLAKIVEEIKVAEEKLLSAERQGGGKETPLMFIVAALFLISAIGGFFASPVFLALLAPSIVFLALGIKGAKRKKESGAKVLEIKSELLNLKQSELNLRERANRAETALRVQIEHRTLIESENQKQKEALQKIDADIKETTAKITALLGTEIEFAEEKLTKLQSNHNRLDSLSLLLSQSAFADFDTAVLEEMLDKTEYAYGLKAPAEYENMIAKTASRINETGIMLEREKVTLQSIFGGKRGIAALERLIAEKEELLSSQDAHYDALSVAADALFAAYTRMRQNFAPELNRMTSEIFESLTGGVHSSATVAKDFSVRVSEKGTPLPFESEYLSAGTRDQLDFALRLSIAKLTAGDNNLPLLLDDVFSQYDDRRAQKAIEFLSDYAKENQILFFTCHGDIRETAKENGAEIKAL